MSGLQAETGASVAAKEQLPGAALRQAREAQGLSVAEVAEKLNLTLSAVQSLETGCYDTLPGVTFTRGYIRSYAKLLGLDENSLVQQYTETTNHVPVKPLPSLEPQARRSGGRFLMLGFAVVVLLATGAAYYWWQEEQASKLQSSDTSGAFTQVEVERADGTLHIQSLDDLDAQTAALAVAEINLTQLMPGPEEETAYSAREDGVEAGEEQPAAAEAGQPATAAANDSASATAEQATDSATSGTAESPILGLSFADECWIRVTDASGRELHSGLKQAGETLELTGKAPFELHLGNARGVSLTLNGQAVDFEASIRGNVARLKVGQ